MTLRNLHHGTFSRLVAAEVVAAKGNHLVPLAVWWSAVAALVWQHFHLRHRNTRGRADHIRFGARSAHPSSGSVSVVRPVGCPYGV